MANRKFKNTNSDSYTLALLIYENQNILRYLNYLTDEPLATETVNSQGETVSQADVDLPFEDSGIILGEYDESVLSENQCKLFLSPAEFDLPSQQGIGDSIYLVNIIIPKHMQTFEGTKEFRSIKIAEEIANMVDGERVAGIGKVEVYKAKGGKVNDNYCYFTLWIRAKTITLNAGK